ncbi:ADP-ribosylation [Schizophyllum commune Loenen D]|nr:ADP-ribosylation [Schizophyllum commune Loenen D]
MSLEVLDLTWSDWDDDAFLHDRELRDERVSDTIDIVESVAGGKGKARDEYLGSNRSQTGATNVPWPVQQRRSSGNTNKRPVATDDDEVEVLEGPVTGPSKPRPSKRQRTSPSENIKPKGQPSAPSNAASDIASTSTPRKNVRPPKVTKRTLAADERLARKLAAEERKEYEALCKQIEKKKEGIVFRVVVNADGNLADGSPAHPDDLDRFEPWRQLFEKGSTCKVKRFHWIVNYELEKRFEEARVKLREIMGCEPEEKQLFHGTSAENIDSILNEGFRIGGVGKHRITNGSVLGYGIYLAQDGMTSMGYAAGADRMFACRVLLGRVTHDHAESMRRPTQAVGSGRYESYNNNNVYVVRHTALVLPCYMIEWDVDELHCNVNAQHNHILAMGAMGAALGVNVGANNLNAGDNFDAMMGGLLGGAPNGAGPLPFMPQTGTAPPPFPAMLTAPASATTNQAGPASAVAIQRANVPKMHGASVSSTRKGKRKAPALAKRPSKYDEWPDEYEYYMGKYGEWPDEYDEVHHLDSPDPYEEC